MLGLVKQRGGQNEALIERYHSRDTQQYWFNKTENDCCIKIEFNPVPVLFWDTNMTAVTLRENPLLDRYIALIDCVEQTGNIKFYTTLK